VELVARSLQFISAGVHTFLRITPDSPSDFGVESSFTFTMGGQDVDDKLQGIINYPGDLNANQDSIKMTEVIRTPEGISDTEFISNILEVHGRLGDEDYNAASFNLNGRNCNNYSTSLLEGAGSEVPDNFDPNGANPGLGESIPGMLDPANNDINVGWRENFNDMTDAFLPSQKEFASKLNGLLNNLSKRVESIGNDFFSDLEKQRKYRD